jgi:hypothetical protein
MASRNPKNTGGCKIMAKCRYKTQQQLILTHLKCRQRISPKTAWINYGCMRLAEIIRRIKEDGHNVITEMVQDGRSRHAVYFLEKKK